MQQIFIFLLLAWFSSQVTPKSLDTDVDHGACDNLEKKTLRLDTKIAEVKLDVCALEVKMNEKRDMYQNQLGKMTFNMTNIMERVDDHTAVQAALRVDIDHLMQNHNNEPPTKGTECRDGWLKFGDNCYLFSKDKAPWGESSALCAAFHSHLAIFESAADYGFVRSTIREKHTGGVRGIAYWVDGNDIEVEDVWRWTSTGKRIEFLMWAPLQPNNGHASNCMSLFGTLSFDMCDEHCVTSYYYVCQMSVTDAREVYE